MKSRALIVPRANAESVRRRLREAGALRADLAVLREDDHVIFALRPEAHPDPLDGVESEREFPEVELPAAGYRDRVRGIPDEIRDRLPRAFDVIGDVVLIRLPSDLVRWAPEIGRALLEFVPGARQVGWDRGVRGVERRRDLVPIAGSGGFRTRHRENGLEIEVDLDRAYFSPRLAHEHARVASEVRPGERVFDLCCGVGPFALTIARDGRARSIVAVDLNPEAIELLRSNADRLGLSDRIEAIADDVARFLERSGLAERAVLNLPHEGIKYLASVANRVGPAGTLHYYEMMERSRQLDRPHEIARSLGTPTAWTVRATRVVHPYSPTADLVSVTFQKGTEAG